jgi:hypothetical protein
VQNLLERSPFTFYNFNPKPISRVDKSLLRQQFLSCFATLKLIFPLRNCALHFLNFGNEQSDVIALFKRELFELSSPVLDFVLERLHLVGKCGTKFVEDLFVDLVVLVIDLALHGGIVHLHSTKHTEIFGGVKCLATLPDLVQHLIPLVDVFAEHLVDVLVLDVPE